MGVTSFEPMLTVTDAAAAVRFYERAFDATVLMRAAIGPEQELAEMSIDGHRFYVVDENPPAFNVSPETLGGTSVRMNLTVDDADAFAAQAVAAGATVIFPVADQPYGLRQGRVADPYGHHWIIGTPLPT